MIDCFQVLLSFFNLRRYIRGDAFADHTAEVAGLIETERVNAAATASANADAAANASASVDTGAASAAAAAAASELAARLSAAVGTDG